MGAGPKPGHKRLCREVATDRRHWLDQTPHVPNRFAGASVVRAQLPVATISALKPLRHLYAQRVQHRTREAKCARAATEIRRVTGTIREHRIDGSVYCDRGLTKGWLLFPM